MSTALKPRTIYEAWDRLVCSNQHCAGPSVLLTGATTEGYRVRAVTTDFALDWARYGAGLLTCQCGHLLASLGPAGVLEVVEAAELR